MSESVNLPALGESVTEGTVTRWLKNVGDRVEVDEPLLEVSTDKVDTEIPSPVAGIIEQILVAEDETVEVGTPLVIIGSGAPSDAPAEAAPTEAASIETPSAEAAAVAVPSTDAPAPAEQAQSEPAPSEPAPSEPAPVAASAPAPAAAVDFPPAAQAPEPVAAAPAAVQVPAANAAAESVPATPVAAAPIPAAPVAAAPIPAAAPASTPTPAAPSSAPAAPTPAANAGYVTPLVRKLAHEQGVDLAQVTGTGVGGRIRKEDVLAFVPAKASSVAPAGLETSPLRGTTVAMSRLRRVIAERAVASMQVSAQLTSVVEVDVTRIANYRDSVKIEFAEKAGAKLTFLPFFALAATEALKAYPIVNATIDGDSIVYPAQENLSIAVDTERGLLTPVIRNAAGLSLSQLAQQISDLAERTRNNKLTPDELSGGTFTLTNTGSRGALFDTPIVFMPQSAILGTGIVTKKPAVVSIDGTDAIAIRSTVFLALSYDHRIVDGADAARFLVAVKDRLEAGDFAGNLGL
ncbi:MAG: 2-oxo acid dehydrogenase subunit E2 [Microbacteriaceae bacterium]|nr:2-oxo acid dehydrogenase subunit E2 [Microbacteriaceae bacterium]